MRREKYFNAMIGGDMKLSEILGWIKKKPLITGQGANNRNKDVQFCRGFNTALTSCDREIDREALAKELYQLYAYLFVQGYDTKWDDLHMDHRKRWITDSSRIISTMPTWLKKVD